MDTRLMTETARAMVAIERTVEPITANRAAYDDLFGRYVATYEALNAGEP